MNQFLVISYWIVGILYSGLLASDKYVRDVHLVNNVDYGALLKFQQRLLNFLGAFIGWCALGYFLRIKFGLPYKIQMPNEFSISDLFMFIFFFFGINGKLPWFIIQKWKWSDK